ncbi:serine/threonine-protein kinase [Streptomyces sp. cmx-18-6]|uniref:serine/threonine-protein kinase n=1 Tax=Streptomyces sp. cmx-18-6 TaxID=2790930 RepID=UPI00397F4566
MDQLTHDDPSHIGPYRLLARLGSGGMGEVYLARSAGGRTVAVKLVRSELAAEPEFRRRFAQEIASARRVGGAWTASVLDADTDAATPWVATGYVPGPTLHSVIADRPDPLPERSVLILANRLAQALGAVHAAGLIHRDLKPANILVTIDGPRVIDFGIAHALDAVTADGKLTRTGAIIGSPGYMSPEQVRGEALTPVSDVFSLGSVLMFAATRRQPFGTSHSGMHAVMFRIAQEEPDLEGLPDALRDLVRDCLAKNPADRPTPADVVSRTADAVADAADEPWLPATLIAELGRKAAELLDSEAPRTRLPNRPSPPPPTTPPPVNRPAPAFPPPPAAAPTPPPATPAPSTPPLAPPAQRPTAPDLPPSPAPGPLGASGAPAAFHDLPTHTDAATPHPGTTSHPGNTSHPSGPGAGQGAGPGAGQGAGQGAGPGTSAPPAPRRNRRRTALVITSAAAAIALVAGGATYLVTANAKGDGDRTNDSANGAGSPSASAPSSRPAAPVPTASTPEGDPTTADPNASSAVEGVITDEYLGVWQGMAKRGGKEVTFRRITITQGSVGADVATTFNSFGRGLCTGAAELISFDNLMVLKSRLLSSIPDDICVDGGKQTLRAGADGKLVWTSGDGDEVATLDKVSVSSTPVPAQFLGTWEAVPSADDAKDGGRMTGTLKLSQAPYGEVVARYTGDGPAFHCEWESVLINADSDGVRLGPHTVTASEPENECDKRGSRMVRMKGKDGLSLTWLDRTADPVTYRRVN